ncbi:hypothetical protein ACWGJ9_11005 [Curtobacterium citreum]
MRVDLNAQLTPSVEQILNDVSLAEVHAALVSGAPVQFQTMSPYRSSRNPKQPLGQPLTGKHEVTVTFTAIVETVHAEVMQVTRDVFQGQNLFTAVVRWEVPAATYSGLGWTWRHVEFHDGRAAWWKSTDEPKRAC